MAVLCRAQPAKALLLPLYKRAGDCSRTNCCSRLVGRVLPRSRRVFHISAILVCPTGKVTTPGRAIRLQNFNVRHAVGCICAPPVACVLTVVWGARTPTLATTALGRNKLIRMPGLIGHQAGPIRLQGTPCQVPAARRWCARARLRSADIHIGRLGGSMCPVDLLASLFPLS